LATEITLSSFQQAVDHWLDQSQLQPVKLMRDGEPFVVIMSYNDWLEAGATFKNDTAAE
jgi:hypothetical protein